MLNFTDIETVYQSYKYYILGTEGSVDNLIFLARALAPGSYIKDRYPIIAELLQISATLVVSSVDCERAFSGMNRIKTSYRNGLSVETCSDLLIISRDGPECDDLDVKTSLKLWKQEKERLFY